MFIGCSPVSTMSFLLLQLVAKSSWLFIAFFILCSCVTADVVVLRAFPSSVYYCGLLIIACGTVGSRTSIRAGLTLVTGRCLRERNCFNIFYAFLAVSNYDTRCIPHPSSTSAGPCERVGLHCAPVQAGSAGCGFNSVMSLMGQAGNLCRNGRVRAQGCGALPGAKQPSPALVGTAATCPQGWSTLLLAGRRGKPPPHHSRCKKQPPPEMLLPGASASPSRARSSPPSPQTEICNAASKRPPSTPLYFTIRSKENQARAN